MVFYWRHLQSALTFNSNFHFMRCAAQNWRREVCWTFCLGEALCCPSSAWRCIYQKIKFIAQRDRRPQGHSSKPGCFLGLNLKINSVHRSCAKEDVRAENRDWLTSVFLSLFPMTCFKGVHTVDCSYVCRWLLAPEHQVKHPWCLWLANCSAGTADAFPVF